MHNIRITILLACFIFVSCTTTNNNEINSSNHSKNRLKDIYNMSLSEFYQYYFKKPAFDKKSITKVEYFQKIDFKRFSKNHQIFAIDKASIEEYYKCSYINEQLVELTYKSPEYIIKFTVFDYGYASVLFPESFEVFNSVTQVMSDGFIYIDILSHEIYYFGAIYNKILFKEFPVNIIMKLDENLNCISTVRFGFESENNREVTEINSYERKFDTIICNSYSNEEKDMVISDTISFGYFKHTFFGKNSLKKLNLRLIKTDTSYKVKGTEYLTLPLWLSEKNQYNCFNLFNIY